MNLTSLDRIKYFRQQKTTDTSWDNFIKQNITGVSNSIENHLDREIEKTSRTRYFNVHPGAKDFFITAPPVDTSETITIEEDGEGKWDGAETEIESSSYRLTNNFTGFEIDYSPSIGTNALRILYTGGLALSAVNLNTVVGTVSGLFTLDELVSGGTSGALGKIKDAITTGSIQADIEVIAGIFVTGETITGATSTETTVLGILTTEPLCHTYPDIVMATDMQMVYFLDKKSKLGATSLSAGGASVGYESAYKLLPGVTDMLKKYRIHSF